MLFNFSFYIFSLLIVYTDCTKYKIPNITIVTLFIFLIVFGYMEEKLNTYFIIFPFIILIFFVIILLIIPKAIIGGGDIKYMMAIALYLDPLNLPLFLLLSGLIQMFFLIFFKKFKKRRVAPMAPAMFLAVISSKLAIMLGYYSI